MTQSQAADIGEAGDGAVRVVRGLAVACMLALLFLLITAYQSAASLLSRVTATDVMTAASGAAWNGRIGLEVAYFIAAQLLLHLALGATSWLLALASSTIWQVARARFLSIVVGWFSLLAGATLVYNAYWYPRTLIGAYYNDLVSINIGPVVLAKATYLGVVALAVFVTLLASGRILLSKSVGSSRLRRAFALLALVGAGALSTSWVVGPLRDAVAGNQDRPHVILLGIDSLRLDQLKRFGGDGLTSNLDTFLEGADIVSDTTTPAARTFSSWVAILTGRSPPTTGARFNLAERSTVAANPTIADVLRANGYRTVYSTDEVRFANIDESFGFDQVITPRIGASDFLIGTYNELPLASVVINTRLGQWLFPFSYANRGVATMFQPETYIDRLERELSFDGPTLLVTHLTASHWPYYVSDTPFGVANKQHADDRPMYRIGLRTADTMFGEVVQLLRRKGALENAIVVVLSDHGEALGLATDSFLKRNDRAPIKGLRAPIQVQDFGHGQSVLSPSQYQVLLGFRAFGLNSDYQSAGRTLPPPATVEDIAPTLLDLLALDDSSLKSTGLSLAPWLKGSKNSSEGAVGSRVRFTETDLAVLPRQDGAIDEVATARENSRFFEVNPETARLNIRPEFAPLALAFKERAAFSGQHLLAALPAGPDAHQYLLFDVVSGSGQLLLGRPADNSSDGQRLWDAIHDHYAGELGPAVAVTVDDWPGIDAAWRDFFRVRAARAGAHLEPLERDKDG